MVWGSDPPERIRRPWLAARIRRIVLANGGNGGARREPAKALSHQRRIEGEKDMTDRARAMCINLTLLSASLLLLPPPAAQLNGQEAWDRGQIVDRNSGQCLIARGNRDDGVAITQGPCHRDDERQSWQMRRTGEIVSRFSGKCVGVSNGSMDNGKPVIQWECNGHESQRWEMRRSGEIVNRNSGKCMGVLGASMQDGAAVVQWECNGHDDQKWSVQIR